MEQLTLISIQSNPIATFKQLRWGGQPYCSECGSINIRTCKRSYICADCGHRFTDTSNTIFHSTKLSLQQWLVAIFLFIKSTRGVSSYALARAVGVTQKTAWGMLTLLRSVIDEQLKVEDVVIADECYIGSQWEWKSYPDKLRLMKRYGIDPATLKSEYEEHIKWKWETKGIKDHKLDDNSFIRKACMQAASADKKQVLGISAYNERKLIYIYNSSPFTSKSIIEEIRQHTANVRTLVTDESGLYRPAHKEMGVNHEVCNHKEGIYTSGNHYSSNRLEGSFSHLRRTIRGTYQWFSRKYAQFYLNEYCFRYNQRSIEDWFRMACL